MALYSGTFTLYNDASCSLEQEYPATNYYNTHDQAWLHGPGVLPQCPFIVEPGRTNCLFHFAFPDLTGKLISSAFFVHNCYSTSYYNPRLDVYSCSRNAVLTQATWNGYSTGNLWQTEGGEGSNDRGTTICSLTDYTTSGWKSINISSIVDDVSVTGILGARVTCVTRTGIGIRAADHANKSYLTVNYNNVPFISVNKVTISTSNLAWTAAIEGTDKNYTISYGTDASATNLGTMTTPGKVKALSGLSANTTYYVKVKANTPTESSSYSTIVSFVTLPYPVFDYKKYRYVGRIRNRFGEIIKLCKILSASWTLGTNGETGLANIVIDGEFQEHLSIKTGDIIEIYATSNDDNEVDLYGDLRFRGQINNKTVNYGLNRSISIQALDYTFELANKLVDFQYWNMKPSSIVRHLIDEFDDNGYVHYLSGGWGGSLIINGGFENRVSVKNSFHNVVFPNWTINLGTTLKLKNINVPHTGFNSASVEVIGNGGDGYLSQTVENLVSGKLYAAEGFLSFTDYQSVPTNAPYTFIEVVSYSGGYSYGSAKSPLHYYYGYGNGWEDIATKFFMHDNDKCEVRLWVSGSPTAPPQGKHLFCNFDDVSLYDYTWSGQEESITNGSSIDYWDTTFDWMEFSNTTISEALEKIAKRIDATWWVDQDQVLWFRKPRTQVNKVIYEKNIESLTLEEDSTEIKNRGLLVGGENLELWFDPNGPETTYVSGFTPDYPAGSGPLEKVIDQSTIDKFGPQNMYHFSITPAMNRWCGQTFQWNTAAPLTQVNVQMKAASEYKKDQVILECSICNVDGLNKPNLASVIESVSISGLPENCSTTQVYGFNLYEGTGPATLVDGNIYAVVLKPLWMPSDTSLSFFIAGNSTNDYAVGEAFYYDGSTWESQTTMTNSAEQIEDIYFELCSGYNLVSPPYYRTKRNLRETFQDENSMNVFGERQYQIRDEGVLTPNYARLLLYYENDKYKDALKKGQLTFAKGNFNYNLGDLIDVRGIISKQYNPGTLSSVSGYYNMINKSWQVDTTYDDNIITFDCLRTEHSITPQDGLKTNLMINYKRPLWEDMTKDLIDRIRNNEQPTDTSSYWQYLIEKVQRPIDTRKYGELYGVQIEKYSTSTMASLLESHIL